MPSTASWGRRSRSWPSGIVSCGRTISRKASGGATKMPSSSIDPLRQRRRRRALITWFLAALLGLFPGVATAHTELAVTIDDLPTTGALPAGTTRASIVEQMIEILRRHAVPGVYGFANGGQLRENPEFENILLAWQKS